MKYQLEVTTRCNFSCSYCSGRAMEQKDMSWETFVSIVDKIKQPSTITLQGEGEPSLHPKFWDMVEYILERKHTPNVTFNGSILDTELIPIYFKSTVGISIDTLDPNEANEIGRINLPKVLSNIRELAKVFPPNLIAIRTVDFGQDLTGIKEYVKDNKFYWQVQSIQKKKDYTDTYSGKFVSVVPIVSKRTNLCSYLAIDKMRYYTVNGLELPCCFIKNTAGITTIENMKHDIPVSCIGCNK